VLPRDDAGSGETVVMLHAGVADRSMWREHVDWLAGEGFRAVAVDLPGFGAAAVAAGPQAPWEDVLVTVRELGLTRVTLIGNSFGAAVALRVAAVAPAAVSALVLVSPSPLELEPSPRLRAAWEAEEAALERGDVDAAVAAVLEAWLQPEAPAELRDRLATMQRRAVEHQLATSAATEAPDPLERHPEALASLAIPVLALAGEHDMPDFQAGAQEVTEHVPDGAFELIPNAGHFAPLEAPAEFRQRLLAFLRAHSRR
jgi:pimeloyl-ACP methyl ester carboxylesterase